MSTEKQYGVGVDLGMVNSCLAYSDGRGHTSLLTVSDGRELLPSVVLFTDKGKLVGAKAKERCLDYPPGQSVSCFKRQMGSNIVHHVRGLDYVPSEIYAILLRKFINDYHNSVGFEIKNLVLTVPGDYGNAERCSTIDVAKIAGIGNVQLLDESLAAAIAYGSENINSEGNFLIYDLGGGTFDATVIKKAGKRYAILANEGSKNLGGRDWDLQMVTLIEKKIFEKTGKTIDEYESDCDLRRVILKDAESIKERLTYDASVSGSIMVDGKAVDFKVTREEFEGVTLWLMLRTVDMVGNSVRDAKLSMKDISHIVLVGGATLMPQVKSILANAYPSTDIVYYDPEHAVARGAAIYAESYFNRRGSIEVSSVLTKTLGILGGIDGVEKVCNVLYRNVPLPLEHSVVCRPKHDDQDKLEIDTYESTASVGEEYVGVDVGNLVAKAIVPLRGKVSRGRTRINLKFTADTQGLLRILVECNGETFDCWLSDRVSMTSNDILESRRKIGGQY